MGPAKYIVSSLLAIATIGIPVFLLRPGNFSGLESDVGSGGAVLVIVFFQMVYAVLSLPGLFLSLWITPEISRRLPEVLAAALLVSMGANIGLGFVLDQGSGYQDTLPWMVAISLICFALVSHAGALLRRRSLPGRRDD